MSKMSRLQLFNEFLSIRLPAAVAAEISAEAEKMFRSYQREIDCAKEEIARLQRLLDLVLKPDLKLWKAEPPRTMDASTGLKEDPSNQQDLCASDQDFELKIQKEESVDLPAPPRDIAPGQEEEEPSGDQEIYSSDQNFKLEIKKEETVDFPDTPRDIFTGLKEEPIDKDIYPPIDSLKIIIKEEDEDISDPPEDISTGLEEEPTDHQDINQYQAAPGRMQRSLDDGESPCCDYCGKSFSSKKNLRLHQRVHTGEKPYSCEQCGKNFSQQGHLNEHIRIHTGEKPFVCGQCGKSFSQQGHLNEHIRIHTGEKPYFCEQCGKSFTRQDALSRHLRIHTGEKLYSCVQCGKSFSHKSSLKKHLRIHMRDALQL